MASMNRFTAVKLRDGFWRDRVKLNSEVSIDAVKNRFEQSGRFDALRFNYAETGKQPHVYFDSDAAKWIEAVAYLIQKDRESQAENEKFIDSLIDCMEKAQRADGYLNSTFLQTRPDEIFTDRNMHELYCAGHLIEAAVAYDKATGKDKFLRIVERYCDCIERAFITEKTAAFVTPGHEEIELALYKLYKHTGKKKYLDMAKFFLTERGKGKDPYAIEGSRLATQDDTDIYGLHFANGHCVRALYLYCAVADYARETGDETLFANLCDVFDDITTRKMYVTGGVGSTYRGEAFTVPYDLDNGKAYSESCAAIAFILFARRMRAIRRDARFGHLIERVMYNALLSSTGLDGKTFFYENPLSITLADYGREVASPENYRERLPITSRVELFDCSCCPPNINRFFASFGDGIVYRDGEELTIEQFVPSEIDTSLGKIEIAGEYALTGKVTVSGRGYKGKTIAVRIPEWCGNMTADAAFERKDGYARISVSDAFTLSLDFGIRARFVCANPAVRDDAGKAALTFGPTVYCLEGVDNGDRLHRFSVSPDAVKNAATKKDFHGLYTITLDGFVDAADERLYRFCERAETEKKRLTFIPYFVFANRGKSDMAVWVRLA